MVTRSWAGCWCSILSLDTGHLWRGRRSKGGREKEEGSVREARRVGRPQGSQVAEPQNPRILISPSTTSKSHKAHRLRPRPRGLSQKTGHTPVGLGTRKGIYSACPHRNRGKLCSSNPQPPCSWVGAGSGNPQSFGPPPPTPRSRSADFQPVPSTPQVLYTAPFLTSPHSVCKWSRSCGSR